MTYHPSSPRPPRFRPGPFTIAALCAWAVAFIIIAVRLVRLTHRGTTYNCYLDAGTAWCAGRPIYTNGAGMGFVYSPFFGAIFAAFSFLPVWLGKICWLLTNLLPLVMGVYAVMARGIFSIVTDRARALTLLALLPLSIASLDVAQANSALIGLLLLAAAAAIQERWTLAVIAVCLSAYLKIYPLAFGLLLCVYRPRQVIWRLVLALSLVGLISLFLQSPRYVLAQYHDWFATRVGDDRRLNSLTHAPLDLWYLLVRVGHLPISEHAYVALQLLAAAAIALFCLRTPRWSPGRRLAGLFLLCSCWMILLGPATESYTYAILAPAVSLGLVAAFSRKAGGAARTLVALAFTLLLAAQFKSSFFSAWRSATYNGLRPLAALLFLAYVVLWLRDEALWSASAEGPVPLTR